MNRRLILVMFLSLMMSVLQAQPSELVIEGVAPSLHLTHAVAAKETWYSIGRIYNISPKEIAPYNNLTIDKPLAIGQQVKIPLVSTNFAQSPAKASDEVFVPVYHVVQDKEWMYRVSVNYNKVPVENLEKWNSISRDQVKAGIKLVVGYLKVKTGQSSLASKGSPTMKSVAASEAATDAVAVNTPLPSTGQVKKTEPVITLNKTEQVKQETKISQPAEENKPAIVTKTDPGYNGSGGGYFRTMYGQSGKSNSGTAGVFKSTSGWQDGKYYALMNNVPVGTIVKVSGASADKFVYAKVLGQLAEMKENAGLSIRISDAAAAQLNAMELAKFQVDVRY